MRQYLIIFVAAVLLGTMASSCGKKADDQAKMADSVGGAQPAPTPTYSVTVAPATMAGSNPIPGIMITAGNPNTRSATITVTDTSGSRAYFWHGYYGTSNDTTVLVNGVWSQGNAVTWSPGSFTPLPQFWFPQYGTVRGTGSNFSRIVLGTTTTGSSDTVYGVVDGNSNANIRIVIQGGGGEPGK